MNLRVMAAIVLICITFSDRIVYTFMIRIRKFPHNYRNDSVTNNKSNKINLSHLGNKIYGLPSRKSGDKVAKWNKNLGINPEELGEYAEGDILFSTPTSKSALEPEYYRWPGGTVPYLITGQFTSDEYAQILSAFGEFHKNTCVRFVPYNGQQAYIKITSGWAGCFSTVGYSGYSYDVNLQPPHCLQMKGTILHEFMHVLGFIHEHTRYDRDNYVYILWNNIQNGD